MESTDSERDALISNFCSITGVEASRGQFYLESANWNLQLAIQSFFEHSDDMSTNPPNPIEEQSLAQSLGESVVNPPLVRLDQSDDEMSGSDTSSPKTHKKEVKKEVKRQSNSKFATLDTLRQREDSGQSSEEEGQAFYAGGSERSGQQVLGPKKKNPDELVSNMFKSAKAHGAEVVDQTEDQKRKKRFNTFVGTGFRLGSNTEDTKPVNTTSSSSTSKEGNREMVLKLWKNGFSVDDGPVRDYGDPENQEFLASIHNGEIPRELVRQAEGQEVHLNMEDHRSVDFVEQRKPLQAFTGEGHRLGTPVAGLVTSATQVSDPKKCEEDAQNGLKIDTTKPVTSIQIRLSDGQRLVVKINLYQTIADIRTFICKARPAYNELPFVLMTTFPNKELTDETLTIEDAKLANASIVQRLK